MTTEHPKTALVIGAGPAGLMAAEVLSASGITIIVAEQMPSVGRKFLMAGKSGLNLTKIEDSADFKRAYGSAPPALCAALAAFGPQQVIAWAEGLQQPLFTGSTGRVFPVVMKASPLLRAWLARLAQQGVVIRTRWRWTGWDGGAALFETPDGPQRCTPDLTVLAMGGASWRRLGSDGAWANHLDHVAPFQPSNCGIQIAWSAHMARFFGHPVKATMLHAANLTSRGEWTITRTGIEGGGLYTMSPALREGAPLSVDLAPDLSEQQVADRFAAKGSKASISQVLKSGLRLPPVKIALFHEMTRRGGQTSRQATPRLVKVLPLPHDGLAPLDEAISTAGGLMFSGMDGFRLKGRRATYAAGEMLDWDAPTGGYLLTGCLATGRAAAILALNDLQADPTHPAESFG